MATIFIDPDNGIECPPDSIDALSGAAYIGSCGYFRCPRMPSV
ncbi:hypothetical protein EMIT0373P_60016 [Pseudomonas chlororaphis]